MCQEFIGADYAEVAAIENDDDDEPIDFERFSQEIFGMSLEETVEVEKDLHVCDNEERNWDEPASTLLDIFREEEEEQQESGDESEDLPAQRHVNILEVLDHVAVLQQFARNKGMIQVLQSLNSVASKFEREYLKSQNHATQSLLTDYFAFGE